MKVNGGLIAALRRESEQSLRDLADRANVDPSYLSRVERGLVDPSPRWVQAIADAYAMPARFLALPDDDTRATT
jgi:transcriptional regulator with XRE-family HTH domain